MWPFSRLPPQPEPSAVKDGSTTAAAGHPPIPPPPSQLDPSTVEVESPASLAKSPWQITGYPNERLSIIPAIRWQIVLLASFTYGASFGVAKGGRIAADRYRAMNSHRQPATQAGWYLYHRSKSYHTVVGGVKGGIKQGGILSFWTSVFMGVEEGLDQARVRLFAGRDGEVRKGQRDFVSTVVAALTTAGVYSRWKRMDSFATATMGKVALRYGIVYGLAQDVMSTIRGESPAYVSRAKKALGIGVKDKLSL
jgi:hypothetical protein